jgi:hypothetical protein
VPWSVVSHVVHRVVVLMALVSALACSRSSPTAPAPPSRQQFVLGPGQSAAIQGTAYALRFDAVEGDSRCPADAFCVLAGDAVVKVSVLTATSAQACALRTGTMRPCTYADLTVSLVQLDPYPFSARPIEPADYRATLLVTR